MYGEISSLDEVLAESKTRRVMILKHSSACPLSARGKREVENYLEAHPEMDAYLVVVQNQRPLSNEIEEKLGVRHETPQLLLIEDGKASLFWSHFQITKQNLESEIA